jgi:hypothetical protein
MLFLKGLKFSSPVFFGGGWEGGKLKIALLTLITLFPPPKSSPGNRGGGKSRQALDAKPEQDHIAIFEDVFFTFNAQQAFVFDGGGRT